MISIVSQFSQSVLGLYINEMDSLEAGFCAVGSLFMCSFSCQEYLVTPSTLYSNTELCH